MSTSDDPIRETKDLDGAETVEGKVVQLRRKDRGEPHKDARKAEAPDEFDPGPSAA